MKSDDRRSRIVAAALRVVARDGAAAATTRSIAREAGVNLATLHSLFGSKDRLLLMALARTTVQLLEVLLPPGGGYEGPREAITQTMSTLWELADRPDRPALVRCELQLHLQRRPACMRATIEQRDRYLGALTAIYQRAQIGLDVGLHAGTLARLVAATVDSLALYGSHEEDMDPAVDFRAEALHAILDLVTAETPATTSTPSSDS